MHDQDNITLPAPRRAPWNKGKLTGAKPPLRPKHVWAIRTSTKCVTAGQAGPVNGVQFYESSPSGKVLELLHRLILQPCARVHTQESRMTATRRSDGLGPRGAGSYRIRRSSRVRACVREDETDDQGSWPVAMKCRTICTNCAVAVRISPCPRPGKA
jgi:hypothetical protein